MKRRPSRKPSSDLPLAFEMERQSKDNWCWAAVSVSLVRFHRRETLSQCAHADRVLGKRTCCAGDAECDVPTSLRDSLRAAEVLDEFIERPLSLLDIRRQIARERPIAVRIGWDNDGGGHFVVIDAVFANDLLRIEDPAAGETVLTYDALLRYQNAGDWTHTYTTKP